MTHRALTNGEFEILAQIQQIYGPQNTAADVSVDDAGDAFIFIKDRTNASVMVAALTTLAKWYSDGLIKSMDDLRDNWLKR